MKVIILILSFCALLVASDDRVPPVSNTLYEKECGSCHFAYQPQLLPKRSWSKMLATLENHFGSDATLDEKQVQTLKVYLLKNSKGSMRYIRDDEIPMSITKTPYFVKEHREIPQSFIQQKEVRSLSNCLACHTNAKQGDYDRVLIPNHRNWDD